MAADPKLEVLYDAHAQALFGFVMSLTRNEDDTRDILQEVFVKVAARPSLLDDIADPRAFLLRMAHNLFHDLVRRRSARGEREHRAGTEAPLFAPAPNPDEQACLDAMERALASLPESQRVVVFLKLWEEMTFQAIAELLSESPHTVASRYRYGLDKLRGQLRPFYDEIVNP